MQVRRKRGNGGRLREQVGTVIERPGWLMRVRAGSLNTLHGEHSPLQATALTQHAAAAGCHVRVRAAGTAGAATTPVTSW